MNIIGTVCSEKKLGKKGYPFNVEAKIIIKEELIDGLSRLGENSHIWVICLYDRLKEDTLKSSPQRVNSTDKDFGVFALRSPNHPNPIALSLCKLKKIENNFLYLENLDAYDGTKVIDIKPYYEYDSIFSFKTSRIVHDNVERRKKALCDLALNHHKERCRGSDLAVRMILYIESQGIDPKDDRLSVVVRGDLCVADTIQGLCRARLQNPPRFYFENSKQTSVIFTYEKEDIEIKLRENEKGIENIIDEKIEDIFDISNRRK